jgi:hypothetical protein
MINLVAGMSQRNYRSLIISLLLCVQMVAWMLLAYRAYSDTALREPPASQSATQSGIECKSGDIICSQEAQYRVITRQSGVQAAFAQLRADYAADDESARANCHPLTHIIGRTAAEGFTTVAEAYAEGDEFCWSGYYHGVMEAMLSKIAPDEVVNQINTICADIRANRKFSFDHYNCVHGLGHGVMLISSHQLFDSLKSCDNLNDSWERESCYGGVFMENVMAEINPGHSTKYIIADQPLYPCTAVQKRYKQQCYLMQTSQALTSLNGDFEKVFDLCGGIEAQYRATCYQSLGRDASGRSVSDAAQTRQTCMLGKDYESRSNCFIGAVKDFISYHHSDVQAKEFCDSLEQRLQSICSNTAAEYYTTFR